MRKKLIGLAIVAWWLVMMVSLIRHSRPGGSAPEGPPLDTATLADTWRDSDEWMELRWNQATVGIMRTSARRLPPTAILDDQSTAEAEDTGENPESEPAEDRFQVTILIGLAIGPFHARATTSALLNERLILDQFSLRLNLAGLAGTDETELHVDGLARSTTLLVRLERGDTRQFRSVKLAHPVSLAEGLAPLYGRSDLKVGDTYTLPAFDPVWNMQGGTLTVHVADRETLSIDGKEIETLRIETQMANLKTTTWVDETGVIWKRRMPPLEMTAIDPDLALKRQPWMAHLPPPPHLTLDDMQGKAYGEPLGANGLLGVLRGALNPKDSQQQSPTEEEP